MPKHSDSTSLTQAQFDRLTGGTRDGWRKWDRRRLVNKSSAGYGWPQVVEAIALLAIEQAAGMEAVVHCWDDIHEDLLTQIRSPVLDIVIDPGVAGSSRPRMRAFLSTSDDRTASLARAAYSPTVLALAEVLADARDEYERTIERAQLHADNGTDATEKIPAQDQAS
jgi:hypothetical protein